MIYGRVCGWRAMHAVSLGHLESPFVTGVRVGAKTEPFPSARFYGTTICMKKSIKVAPKKRSRGRPPSGGRDPHIAARMPASMIAKVEAWAKANDTNRSDAIRRLVELGLKAKGK